MKKLLILFLFIIPLFIYPQNSSCGTSIPFVDNNCVFIDPASSGPITICYSFIVGDTLVDFDFNSFVPSGTCIDIDEQYELFDNSCNLLYLDTLGVFDSLVVGGQYTVCYTSYCPTDGIINAICSSETLTLPIQLIYFNGIMKFDIIELNWSTASENNNSHFNIYNSINFIDWFDIGSIEAFGNSYSTNYYSFEYSPTYNGVNYFRLKQTDMDGQYIFFDIIAVEYVKSIGTDKLKGYNVIGQKTK